MEHARECAFFTDLWSRVVNSVISEPTVFCQISMPVEIVRQVANRIRWKQRFSRKL
jgi:hypothetical protein